MNLLIDVEEERWNRLPALKELTHRAVNAAARELGLADSSAELAVLFTNDERMAQLNAEWRGKHAPTNVLSFPADDFPSPEGEAKPLGDIVLAEGVISREADEQGKTLPQHVTHLIIHGFLHLAGHDHQDDCEAGAMEMLEAKIMKELGFPNPYE